MQLLVGVCWVTLGFVLIPKPLWPLVVCLAVSGGRLAYPTSSLAPAQQLGNAIGQSQPKTANPYPHRIRVQGSTYHPVYRILPKYPEEAKAKHIGGRVLMHVVVGRDGKMAKVAVLSGDRLLTKNTVTSVRQWRYMPTLLNGEAVEVEFDIEVTFHSDNWHIDAPHPVY
jgi:TonB family protein